MKIKIKQLEIFSVFLFVVVVGFDSSTNFIFKDYRLIFSYSKEILLWIIVIYTFLRNKFEKKFLNFYITYIILSILLSIFYGSIYTYYFFRLAGITYIIKNYYKTYKEIFSLAVTITIFYLVASYFINLLVFDISKSIQGSRFFLANATVVSTASLFLSTQSSFFYSSIGYISGILTGSVIFLVYLIIQTFTRFKNLIYFSLISILSLTLIKNTTSGYKLFKVIDAFKTLDIGTIFKSTTLGIRFKQISLVAESYKFNDIIGENLFLFSTQTNVVESGILYIYAYGGIVGSILNILNTFILFFFAFPKIMKFPLLILILVLLGIAINPITSLACILYTILFIESYTIKFSSENL